MKAKDFKNDLTYSIKKLIKSGLMLTIDGYNLQVDESNSFKLEGIKFCPLESLILIKNISPPSELTSNISKSNQIRYCDVYSFSAPKIISEYLGISREDLWEFLNGYEGIKSSNNEFYKVGIYIRQKFILMNNPLSSA